MRRVLVVDDDRRVRDAYRQILTPEVGDFHSRGARLFSRGPGGAGPPSPEYEIHEAPDGEAAVRAVREGVVSARPFRVAFVDMKMPGMDGAETVRRMWALDPGMKVVIVTAYSDTPPREIVETVGRADLFYLRKPFTPEEIGQFAESLCGQWSFDRKREETLRKKDALKVESLYCMAGAVAHHLNNLLMALGGNLDLLRMDLVRDPPPSRDGLCVCVDRAREAADKLGKLGHHLLSYLGQRLHTAGRTDVSTEAASTLATLQWAEGRGVKVETGFSPGLPGIALDPGVFREMLEEILLNAREALDEEEGHVMVKTGVCRFDSSPWGHVHAPEPVDGDYVFVEVADNGCGMDGDTLERIFDPFFSTRFTGRGLGLAVVQGITGIRRGWIGVSSTPEQGTVFRLCFPAVTGTVAP